MAQKLFHDTYLRLDASSYHHHSFFKEEKNLAQNFELNYERINLSQGDPLPQISPESKVYLVSNTHTPIDKIPDALLQQTTLFIHPNSGYDNFSASWVKKTRHLFPTILGNTIRAQAVSQYIMTELLFAQNKINHQRNWDRERTWERPLLDGQTILLIGLGTIGHQIHQTLLALGNSPLIYDPFKNYKGELSLLVKKADIIILTCGLNRHSYHLFDDSLFKYFKEKVLLINTSRGSLIQEKALIHWLKNSPHSKAIVDVFEEEPFGPQFHSIENLKTTSHIAGVSRDLDQRILHFIHKIIKEYNEGIDIQEKYKTFLLANRYLEKQDLLL